MPEVDRKPGIRPRPTLGRRLDAWARSSVPTAATLLLMTLTAIPFGLPNQAQFLPAVTLASVWFWSLFRPASMPPPIVFLIGLIFDLVGYLPLGAGVLTLLLTHGVALRFRRTLARQGFALVWLAFAGIAAGAAALDWAIASVLMLELMPAGAAIFQCALSIAVYPALAILFARAHHGVADPERA